MVMRYDELRRCCRAAVDDGVVPGLVVAVGSHGQTVFLEAFGMRQLDPTPSAATVDTVYDLASLTKALVTSLLVMRAVAAGELDLDEPLLPSRGASPTVRQALAHAAGFPAHRPFHERLPPEAVAVPGTARAAVVALAADEPFAYPPGTRSIYSDIGFILLGDLLERRMGVRLDDLAAALFAPLRVPIAYMPVDRAVPPPLAGASVAPTQRSPLRGRTLCGEVDDLNAYLMGGVAGHAGLFGTAGAVAAVAHALCGAWQDRPAAGAPPLVPAAVLRAFWAPAGVPASTWRLGWDGPAPTNSLAGTLLSRSAVGHLAFTGPSLWIDPRQQVFVAVLTNRVHPVVRDDPRFRALRPALNDAALAALGYRG